MKEYIHPSDVVENFDPTIEAYLIGRGHDRHLGKVAVEEYKQNKEKFHRKFANEIKPYEFLCVYETTEEKAEQMVTDRYHPPEPTDPFDANDIRYESLRYYIHTQDIGKRPSNQSSSFNPPAEDDHYLLFSAIHEGGLIIGAEGWTEFNYKPTGATELRAKAHKLRANGLVNITDYITCLNNGTIPKEDYTIGTVLPFNYDP